jgi:hypothetical protein
LAQKQRWGNEGSSGGGGGGGGSSSRRASDQSASIKKKFKNHQPTLCKLKLKL